MRKGFIVALMALIMPLAASAQDYQQADRPRGALFGSHHNKKKNNQADEAKYLAGAVPVDNSGKVVFHKRIEAQGLSADEVFNRMKQSVEALTQQNKDLQGNGIVLADAQKHEIVATVKEWLVFTNKPLNLDRSIFGYNLVVNCGNGYADVHMTRIYYNYEQDRPTGFQLPAEETITDDNALNKKKTALNRAFGKFRRLTIDCKDQLFAQFESELKS